MGPRNSNKNIINIHFSLITKSVILWSNNQTETFNYTPLMACVLPSPRLSWVRVWPSAGVGMRCTDFPVSCLRTCSQCRGVRGAAWYMEQTVPVTTWFISPDSKYLVDSRHSVWVKCGDNGYQGDLCLAAGPPLPGDQLSEQDQPHQPGGEAPEAVQPHHQRHQLREWSVHRLSNQVNTDSSNIK